MPDDSLKKLGEQLRQMAEDGTLPDTSSNPEQLRRMVLSDAYKKHRGATKKRLDLQDRWASVKPTKTK